MVGKGQQSLEAQPSGQSAGRVALTIPVVWLLMGIPAEEPDEHQSVQSSWHVRNAFVTWDFL